MNRTFDVAFIIVSISGYFLVLSGVVLVPGEQVIKTFENYAQFSVTLALGIGAIILAVKVKGASSVKAKLRLLRTVLMLMLFGVVSLFITLGNDSLLIARFYLGVSGFFQLTIIFLAFKFISKHGEASIQ